MPDLEVYIKFPEAIYLRREEDSDNGPHNAKRVLSVSIDDGIKSVVEGEKYPRKGYPHRLFVENIGAVKAFLVFILRVLAHLPFLIPLAFLYRKFFLVQFSRLSNKILRDRYFKPQFYQASTREIYRVGMLYPYDEEVKFNLVMLLVMIWEWDYPAYRCRGQFALQNIDKELLEKNPRRELKRICSLMAEREFHDTMKGKWLALRRLLTFLPVKKLSQILLELDQDKIMLDEADYWVISETNDQFDYE